MNYDAMTLAGALQAARQGAIEDWVHEFLLTIGKNEPMSVGLKKQQRFWWGPVQLELSRLIRCCGPEQYMEYPVDPERFEQYVAEMVTSVINGWQPPPLIAVYDHGALSLRDGNHRHEALTRAGFDCYWTIVWFNDEQDYALGCRQLTAFLR